MLHGDNTLKSREELGNYLENNRGKEVVRLGATGLTWEGANEAFRGMSLFGNERMIVMEKLFSCPVALRKKILDLIKKTQDDVVLWEEKKLTVAQLKSLGKTKIKEFRIGKVLFRFLEGIRAGKTKEAVELLHLTLEQEAEELVWAMLERQVRLLILVKTGELEGMAEWQKKKFQVQAGGFTKQKLVEMYLDLVKKDWQRKTTTTVMNLTGILDLYLVEHL